MEIPGLFPHFPVCESDCGAPVLLSAEGSTEGLCPYPESSFIPSSEELGLRGLHSKAGLRSRRYPGRAELALPQPLLQPPAHSSGLLLHCPAQELVVPGPGGWKPVRTK